MGKGLEKVPRSSPKPITVNRTLIPTLLAAFLFCATATRITARGLRIVPSEPLSSTATLHQVSGRNGILIRQKLRFGPYYTTEVRRGWIKSWGGATGVPGRWIVEVARAKQAIHFSLSDGSNTVRAQTLSRTKSDDIILGPNRNAAHNVAIEILAIGTARQANNFSARFALASGGPEWQLFLDNTAAQLHRREAAGFLENEAGFYSIFPLWRVQSRKGRVADMPFGSAGLEIVDEQGRAVAAVSMIDNGAVQIDEALPAGEKLILAAACSALLLQSNLD